ncbi:uncharacterized protein LOC123205702 [Mangifera indica]|uniref:uncharacterized protein LOC123205702 n=1 Tax=Mangifera indica TaxID=29780 RepID=UPI001CF93FC2|nr:uncharacterized protein LOC123205702 [Mangifera indica]
MEVPMLFFPHDIIEQTLFKLPTKSLLRFKCVRKSWPDLISTRKFAIKHLTETSERFRRFGVFKSGNLREGCISVYSLAAQAASHTEEAEEETICLPLWGEDCCLAPAANECIINRFVYTRVLGSCNEEEKFKEFLSPLLSAGTLKTYLSNYEDCLCEIQLRREKRIIDYTLEVWIMKEYGVNDSRIKLLNLPFDLRFSLMSDIRPLVVLKNGDEVVMVTDWSDMISFNTKTGEVKEVSLRADSVDVVASYKESLVSPNQFCSEHGKY